MGALARLIAQDAINRLREHDATLFASDAEGIALAETSLGWTDLAECAKSMPDIRRRAIGDLGDSVTDIVLLGMGGSSLATLVISEVLADATHRRIHVLDTTAPLTVAKATCDLDPKTTFYIVASKSGGTIEPMTLYAIFRDVADEELGRDDAGGRFIAVTDPGTSLETLGAAEHFHAVFHGVATIGGRFSALSAFGLVPAALLGIDTDLLVERARNMERACSLPAEENPAALLAAFVADQAAAGRNKLTVVSSPQLTSFGLWAEQLVAESLGKEGKGVVPVVELADDMPQGYGPDRAIVVVRLKDDERLAEWVPLLERVAPVLELTLHDGYDIGAEFVRWEYAVALLGVLFGVNPFGQPNVAAAKEATSAVLDGVLHAPAEQATTNDGVALTFAGGLASPGHADVSVAAALGHALAALRAGDFLGVLAYLPDDPELLAPLMRSVPKVSAALGAAVTLELGPRYLHSTGQFHKGGPDIGVYVLVTTRDHADIQVPGREWTLRDLHLAQAEGDLSTLAAAGRRILRVDLPDAGRDTIARFVRALEDAAGVVDEG
jgi:glucose-6-phosphate isomerase